MCTGWALPIFNTRKDPSVSQYSNIQNWKVETLHRPIMFSKVAALLLFLVSPIGIAEANPAAEWFHWEFVNQLVLDAIDEHRGTAEFPSTQFPLAARLVRLAFHDAAGLDGANGILNVTDPENAGLEPAVNILNGLYQNNLASLPTACSKADFFNWAYLAAFHFSVGRTRGDLTIPEIPVRCGRTDPVVADTEVFPSNGGHSTGSDILDYFQTNFGFDAMEATALMGAHSLGGADPNFSGFTGIWTLQRSELVSTEACAEEDYLQ